MLSNTIELNPIIHTNFDIFILAHTHFNINIVSIFIKSFYTFKHDFSLLYKDKLELHPISAKKDPNS
ncbi:hypothetical protein GCM10007183_01780 [Staphylococcus muscae]|uniref:Uncharacterized protein n=1 Tax=Staphylococcus muscae TaxID=1294 RepID=A0ABQ1HKA8_9STAP|nr:hypothetical protein GCM10007183_01780 [Staphylococcus muscae]